MKLLGRLFALVVVLLFSGQASALLATTSGWQYSLRSPTATFPDAETACADVATYLSAQSTTHNWTLTGVRTGSTTRVCDLVMKPKDHPEYNGSNDAATVSLVNGSCPSNSTAVTGGCQCNTNFTEQGGACVDANAACSAKTGQVGVLSWTEGYTRTPDEGDRSAVGGVTSPPPSGEVCDGGCKVSLQLSGAGVQPYVSQSPTSNGLYRRSVDYPMIGLGTACTASAADAPAKKDTPPPACPGQVGEVNGKTVCVGTAAQPVTTTPLGAPPAPAIAGNPPAGIKPTTGEGSGNGSAGRTPSTGSGTNAGGPAAAGVGGAGGAAGGTRTGGGSGNTAKPGTGEEQAACGAPGQPVCAVKVDETGVPSGGGTSFDSANTAVDQAKDSAKGQIDTAGTIQAPAWSFTFQLPTGCTSYATGIKGFMLNPCPYQSVIHDLMSMIWAAVTVFCIIGMVGRTIREA